MSSKSFTFLAIAAAVLPFVSAHGDVHSVVANGKTILAQNPYYVTGTSAVRVMNKNELPEAFIEPSSWRDNSKFSCENSANRPAKEHLTVSAGSAVTIVWQGATGELVGKPGTGNTGSLKPWVHATGPILDYLADCKGNCATFDATNAGWNKIQAMGIDMNQSISSGLRDTMAHKGGVGEPYYPTGKGLWASAKMVQESSKWNVVIPKSLKNGKYLLRHEISSMHSPGKNQNYIACIQLDVINGGSATLPAGTQAKDLYDPNGPFAKFNIYTDKPETFKVPGPALWDGASGSPAPPPSDPKPSASVPSTPKPSNSAPSNPKPSNSAPSNPKPSDKPTDPKPSDPKPPVKCRQRKRSLPVVPSVAKRHHRRRLSAEH